MATRVNKSVTDTHKVINDHQQVQIDRKSVSVLWIYCTPMRVGWFASQVARCPRKLGELDTERDDDGNSSAIHAFVICRHILAFSIFMCGLILRRLLYFTDINQTAYIQIPSVQCWTPPSLVFTCSDFGRRGVAVFFGHNDCYFTSSWVNSGLWQKYSEFVRSMLVLDKTSQYLVFVNQ